VNTFFAAQVSIGEVALHRDGDRFQSRFFSCGAIEDFGLVSFQFRPTQVHAFEHRRPVLRISTAGASVNCQQGVARVISARKQDTDFLLSKRGFELCDARIELFSQAAVIQLEQGFQPIKFRGYSFPFVELILESGDAFHRLLRGIGIIPELLVFAFLLEGN